MMDFIKNIPISYTIAITGCIVVVIALLIKYLSYLIAKKTAAEKEKQIAINNERQINLLIHDARDLIGGEIGSERFDVDLFTEKDRSNLEIAYRKLLDAEAINPNHPIVLYTIGIYFLKKGNYDKAAEYLKMAIKNDENCAPAYSSLGVLYKTQQEYSKAETSYLRAITIDPNYTNTRSYLGDLYLEKEDYKKAIDSYKCALAIDANYCMALKGLGNCYFNVDKLDKAQDYYHKVLFGNSKDVIAINGLAAIENRKQNYSEAVKLLENAIQYDTTNSSTYFSLGVSYKNLNYFSRSIIAFKKAITYNPEDVNALLNLALVYKENDNEKDARATFFLYLNKHEALLPIVTIINQFELSQKDTSSKEDIFKLYSSVKSEKPNLIKSLPKSIGESTFFSNAVDMFVTDCTSKKVVKHYKHLADNRNEKRHKVQSIQILPHKDQGMLSS